MKNTTIKNYNPLLSVIVPVYNVEKFLNRCLDSIVSQKFSDYELIIVDDGSTDKSPEICDQYAKKYKFITVIHKEHKGLADTRYAGLKIAKGKFIAHIDSDDYISQDYFDEISKILNKYKNLDMIIFDYDTSEWNKKKCLIYSHITGLCEDENIKIELLKRMYNFSLTSWRSIYKKNFLIKHCCKDSRINYSEDYAYTYECLYFAKKIYFHDKVLYFHRCDNKNSIMRSIQRFDFFQVYIYLDYLLNHLYGYEEYVDNCVAEHIIAQLWQFSYLAMYNNSAIDGTVISSIFESNNIIIKTFKLYKILKKNDNIIPFHKLVNKLNYSNLRKLRDKIKKFLIGHKLYFIFINMVWIDENLIAQWDKLNSYIFSIKSSFFKFFNWFK